MTDWTVEQAWQCERHGWNTCPLTPTALRFTTGPCCEDANVIATRSVAQPTATNEPDPADARSTCASGSGHAQA